MRISTVAWANFQCAWANFRRFGHLSSRPGRLSIEVAIVFARLVFFTPAPSNFNHTEPYLLSLSSSSGDICHGLTWHATPAGGVNSRATMLYDGLQRLTSIVEAYVDHEYHRWCSYSPAELTTESLARAVRWRILRRRHPRSPRGSREALLRNIACRTHELAISTLWSLISFSSAHSSTRRNAPDVECRFAAATESVPVGMMPGRDARGRRWHASSQVPGGHVLHLAYAVPRHRAQAVRRSS